MSNLALSEKQAADLLGVSIDTLRRWRRNGTGPRYARLGANRNATIRYTPAALQRFLDENSYGSRAEEVARHG